MPAIKKSTVRRRARNKQKRFTPESLFRMADDAEKRARELRAFAETEPKRNYEMLSDARSLDLMADVMKTEGRSLRGMK